jgi:(2R)-ethylmalonyl-CoA mutase
LAREVIAGLRAAGLGHVPVIVGGIIPPADADILRAEGAAAVYTPKDFAINRLVGDIVTLVEPQAAEAEKLAS